MSHCQPRRLCSQCSAGTATTPGRQVCPLTRSSSKRQSIPRDRWASISYRESASGRALLAASVHASRTSSGFGLRLLEPPKDVSLKLISDSFLNDLGPGQLLDRIVMQVAEHLLNLLVHGIYRITLVHERPRPSSYAFV